jgi:Uncharacterized protein conserved in bacteria (DUF2188)
MANLSKGSTRSAAIKKSRKKSVFHVVSKSGGWGIQGPSRRFISVPDKSSAIDTARRFARDSGSEVLVHGTGGQVFQRSPVPSTMSEGAIRRAVRATNEKSAVKGGTHKVRKALVIIDQTVNGKLSTKKKSSAKNKSSAKKKVSSKNRLSTKKK